MTTPMLVQAVVVALIVGWSAVVAMHRLLPVASRRAQVRLVGLFDHAALPLWLRAVARRMQPRSSSGGSCGDGCSSCGGCAAAAKPAEALPLVFRPRRKN
ncbi:MAG: DUF6587 family protein [Dokdonella sp.]